MTKVLRLNWDEVRREQETIPAGYSYHLNQGDRESFVAAYWEDLAQRARKHHPHVTVDCFEPALYFETFSRPRERSETWVEGSQDVLTELRSGKTGVRTQT